VAIMARRFTIDTRPALAAWVEGVNQKGGFGTWAHAVAFEPSEIHDLLEQHAAGA